MSLKGLVGRLMQDVGSSVEEHSRGIIDEQRAARLNKAKYDRQDKVREDDQAFRTGERVAGEGFTAEQNKLDRASAEKRTATTAGAPTRVKHLRPFQEEDGTYVVPRTDGTMKVMYPDGTSVEHKDRGAFEADRKKRDEARDDGTDAVGRFIDESILGNADLDLKEVGMTREEADQLAAKILFDNPQTTDDELLDALQRGGKSQTATPSESPQAGRNATATQSPQQAPADMLQQLESKFPAKDNEGVWKKAGDLRFKSNGSEWVQQ